MLAKIVFFIIILISISFLICGYSNSDKIFTLISILLAIVAFLFKSILKVKFFIDKKT